MPRNPYPGRKLQDSLNYFETKVSFDKIVHTIKLQNLIKPDYQGALSEDRVNSMVKEYISKPNFFYFKNRVVIGDLNDSWYIIDGQHRLDMCKKLYTEHNINNELIFCWYIFTEENSMRDLFTSINHDSTKNQFYIKCDTFEQIKISEFMKLMQLYYKDYFAKKKTETGKRKTLEEFRDELIKTNYFKNDKEAQTLFVEIDNKNKEFYNLNRYKITMNQNQGIFYKDELNCLQDGVIISLKNNNFIEWLLDNNIPPYHNYKIQKTKIPIGNKKLCWQKEFKDNKQGICPISFCNNNINNVTNNGFQAGHIISEYNKGSVCASNLRPICKKCNLSMGSKNWIDYDPESMLKYN